MAPKESIKEPVPYCRMTLAMAIGLAGPYTWAASIMPVLAACAMSYAITGKLSVSLSLSLLVICIALQSCVNVLDDYFDFKKGADSISDNLERSDAVLLYNSINPKSALMLAIGLLIFAFLVGIYPIIYAGWIPLAIAAIGACIVVLYSGGRTPISHLPIGEAVSGFTMGGLMCFACYTVLSKAVEPIVFVWAIPMMIGIALIMQSNNTCDIEKDTAAGRRTLPVLLGRDRSRKLYRVMSMVWVASIVVIVFIWFTNGAIVLAFMALSILPILKGMFSNPMTQQSRIGSMSSICVANVSFTAFYACAIFCSGIHLAL